VVPAAVAYEGAGAEVVAALKFRNARPVARHLAAAMAPLAPAVDAVTWVPTLASHTRARGFDQGELLARAVARALGVPARRLLRRLDGPAQRGRSRADRLGDPPRFAVARRPPRRVLVVDDVVTTGATLRSAAAALRAGGADEVHPLAAAATPPGR
jgi:predicted amidophosphoribosyltransferase